MKRNILNFMPTIVQQRSSPVDTRSRLLEKKAARYAAAREVENLNLSP